MKTDIGGWSLRWDQERAQRYRSSGAWTDLTIRDNAEALRTTDPDRITHVFEEGGYRIGALLDRADALAWSLSQRGLKAGDVIAFQLPNWVEAVVIDLAAATLGLVVAPIVPIYRDAEAAFMLADSRAKLLFLPSEYRGFDYLSMMRRLRPELPDLQYLCPVRMSDGGEDSYEAMTSVKSRLPSRPPVDPDAVKLLLYTSGTTGRPKAVLHSHNTMAHTVRRAMRHWGLQAGDTMLMASPVTHITGFGSGIELPLLCGVRTVFMERWNAADGVERIERERVTISMGATPFLQELTQEAERQGRRLPSLRIYACGGAAVPPELIRKSRDAFDHCRAFRVFGSSEVPLTTLGFVGVDQLDLAAETDGEVVHYDVRVTDDDGNSLPNGCEGEIRVRGPAMFLGYGDPAQNDEVFDEDGFFLTGDLGVLTDANAIVITGRKKDLINRGGEKISAKEIEDILHRHPAVIEAACVSMPHSRLGETVCAFAIVKDGQSLDLDTITAQMLRAGVAKQKFPEHLEVVSDFPRTASGKIRKDQLRAQIRQRFTGAS